MIPQTTKVTIEEEDNAYAVVNYVEVYNNLVYDLLNDTLNEYLCLFIVEYHCSDL